jgi:hypothetical protein
MNRIGGVIIGFFALALTLKAAPLDDLASRSQAVRDRAATELRADFKPVPRGRWEPIAKSIKKGQSEENVSRMLALLNIHGNKRTIERSQNGFPILNDGMGDAEFYRLDDQWTLTVHYQFGEDKVDRSELANDIGYVFVDPPKHFTGSWTCYYTNGVRAFTIEYKNGQYYGEWTQFHTNGVKKHVQHYTLIGCDGPDIEYFPSGRIKCRGQYKGNKIDGEWIRYRENGTVKDIENWVRGAVAHPEGMPGY